MRTVRRKSLKFLAAGCTLAFTLPKQWVKPIVQSVTLPAHAQTSNDPRPCPGSPACEITVDFDPSPAIENSLVTVTFTWTNTGDVPISEQSNSFSFTTQSGEVVDEDNITGATLAPGENATTVISVTVFFVPPGGPFPCVTVAGGVNFTSCAGDDLCVVVDGIGCDPDPEG